MKFKFSILTERLKFLAQTLGDRVVVLKEEGSFTQVEVTFEHQAEVLRLFHAGVQAGLEAAYSRELSY